METLDAIGHQRVIRQFTSEPVTPAELARILEAGRRAGSSKNLQRWAFVVVRDRGALERMSKLGPWCGHIAGASVAIALVTPDPRTGNAPLSVMWDLGIGSCPGTVYEQDACRAILGYPADHHCEFILSLGYPADTTDLTRPLKAGGRHDLAAMVHEERW